MYYSKNLEYFKEAGRKWRKGNLDKVRAYTAKRRCAKLQATPTWADCDLIEYFYKEASRLSVETEVDYQVDHIVPLQNELVCGLHNQFNLQILTRTENLVKGNRIWPDMPS